MGLWSGQRLGARARARVPLRGEREQACRYNLHLFFEAERIHGLPEQCLSQIRSAWHGPICHRGSALIVAAHVRLLPAAREIDFSPADECTPLPHPLRDWARACGGAGSHSLRLGSKCRFLTCCSTRSTPASSALRGAAPAHHPHRTLSALGIAPLRTWCRGVVCCAAQPVARCTLSHSFPSEARPRPSGAQWRRALAAALVSLLTYDCCWPCCC